MSNTVYFKKKAKNMSDKKLIARKFVPKAYYKIFDWESYIPGQDYKKLEEPYIQKNPQSQIISAQDLNKLKRELKNTQKISTKSLSELKKGQNLSKSNTITIKNHSDKDLYADFVKEDKKEKKTSEKSIIQELTGDRVKLYHSIGAKLIGIISLLMCIATMLITVLVSYFISADTRINAEENNLTINSRTAADTENRLNSVVSSTGMFLDLLENSYDNINEQKRNAALFFERNSDIIAVILPESERIFYNNKYFISHEINALEVPYTFLSYEEENLDMAKNGDFIMDNVSAIFGSPVIAMAFPIYSSARDKSILVAYSCEALTESYTSGSINMSFLVNKNGQLLIHPDYNLIMEGIDYSSNPVVKNMNSSTLDNSQMNYEIEGQEYIAAYRKLNTGDGGVITLVQTSVVLEAVNATTRRNIYLTMAILFVSIMIIYFFAKTLSHPLKKLTDVTNEINRGNFNTELLNELNLNRKDEIGILVKSTKNEQNILNTFTKMTNKGVTQAIIKKTIDFDPHLKDITIFFSDIRGFTAISDGFKNRFGEKSAGEIIGFLNDYMSRMVNCIKISGGNVDKFEGDAIMACWGVLRDDSLAYESMEEDSPEYEVLKAIHDKHVAEDALSAIKATVAMRYSLAKYNKDAQIFTKAHEKEPLAKYKPHIRIGCGLNSGRATVGFMGSEDKMEFTSIGDAVNLASRTEASNKPCGTDILITEDTYNLLKKNYIRCEDNNFTIKAEYAEDEIIVEIIPVTFEVKGKGKQHFYGVVNMPHFNIENFFKKGNPDFVIDEDCVNVIGSKGPKTLHEVRTLLGIPEPDFGGVNLDEEENKIKIQAP